MADKSCSAEHRLTYWIAGTPLLPNISRHLAVNDDNT